MKHETLTAVPSSDLSLALDLTKRMWAAAESQNWVLLDTLHVEQVSALQACFSVERSALELVQLKNVLKKIKRLHDDALEVASAHRQQSLDEGKLMSRGRAASQVYSDVGDVYVV